MLVFDIGMKQIGLIDKITASLKEIGLEYFEYDKVIPDPPSTLVDEGLSLCKANSCDCVIGIGGGSSIDTAKGINIMRFNDGSILDYATKPMNVCTGLITVPTTSGTGSELSNGAIISDVEHDVKVPILCYNCMSEYTVLDPELTVGMPYKLTLLTGLDVFSHAAEAYTTVLANPMTGLVCEKVMETVVQYLPIVLKDPKNIEARERMQCAASQGGWMLFNSVAHIGHSVAHVLGANLHIIHGAACAYGFPAVFKKVALSCPDKVAYIGRLLGADITEQDTPEQIGEKTAASYKAFVAELGLDPISAKVDEKMHKTLVREIAKEPFIPLTPFAVNDEVIEEILADIFA